MLSIQEKLDSAVVVSTERSVHIIHIGSKVLDVNILLKNESDTLTLKSWF